MELKFNSWDEVRKSISILRELLVKLDEDWSRVIPIFTDNDILKTLRDNYRILEDILDRNSISFKILQQAKLELNEEKVRDLLIYRFRNISTLIGNLSTDDLIDFLEKLLYVDLYPFLRKKLKDLKRRLLEEGVAEEYDKRIIILKDAVERKFGVSLPEDVVVEI